MEVSPKDASVLPNTCGEETNLPGVPSVGCVTELRYRAGAAGGVSACLVASCDAVHILGPDLDQRRERVGSLFSRALWHAPLAYVARNQQTTDSVPSHALPLSNGQPHYPHSHNHSHHRVGQSGGLTVAETSSAIVTSMVAFLLAEPCTGTVGHNRNGSSNVDASDDTVCVCVAWVDARAAHHVSAFTFSLIAALTPSSHAGDLRLEVHGDCLSSLRSSERHGGVLRLFHDSRFAGKDGQHVVACSCYTLERHQRTAAEAPPATAATATAEHPSQNDSRQGTSTIGATAVTGAASVTATTAAAASSSATTVVGANIGERTVGTGNVGAAAGSRAKATPIGSANSGTLRFWLGFVCIASQRSAVANAEPWLGSASPPWAGAPSLSAPSDASPDAGLPHDSSIAASTGDVTKQRNSQPVGTVCMIGEAAEGDVASWLWRFQPGRLVTALEVQTCRSRSEGAGKAEGKQEAGESGESARRIVAAAGTADGRVFLLSARTDRLWRRLIGPITQLVFIDTASHAGPAAARSRLLDRLLLSAPESGKKTATAKAASRSAADLSAVALVVLDAAGSVVVLYGANSAAPVTRAVADVPQLTTLRDLSVSTGAATLQATVDASASAGPSASINSVNSARARSFLDLNTLRRFFSTDVGGKAAHAEGSGTAMQSLPPQSSSGGGRLLESVPLEKATDSRSSGPHLSGHLLSRGLLCATCAEGPCGGPELIVSTLGQAIVSIQFDKASGSFAIAGFTATPTPMNGIAFVDFFNSGAPKLVLTSPRNVLVAHSSQSVLRERAALLARLLRTQAAPSPHAAAVEEDLHELES